ncbi:MAG: hypothetical protein GEV10_04765 [Streptosporangiales bacterium]|nr:hypothetical protein [Streptosporangiales bacterium]
MNGRLEALFAQQGQVVTYGQLLACGYTEQDVRRYLRDGLWLRIRRGAYVARAYHDGLDEVGRHVLRTRAVVLSLGERTVVSHLSAAALYGLPLWDADLRQVHVTRTDMGAARTEGGVHHHVGNLRAGDTTWIDGVAVVQTARAVVETACFASFETAVVAADAALYRDLATPDDLADASAELHAWPYSHDVGAVVGFADGRAESVGESRLRVLFDRMSMPEPVPQVTITDSDGAVVGRVDFLFAEERTVVEFDGKVKYAPDGADPALVLFREKRREDRLRELGYEVVRIVWSDLAHPERVVAKVRAAFARAAARPSAMHHSAHFPR